METDRILDRIDLCLVYADLSDTAGSYPSCVTREIETEKLLYNRSDSLRTNKRVRHSKICSYDASFSSKSSLKINQAYSNIAMARDATRENEWKMCQGTNLSTRYV